MPAPYPSHPWSACVRCTNMGCADQMGSCTLVKNLLLSICSQLWLSNTAPLVHQAGENISCRHMFAGPRGLAPPIPVLSFTSKDSLMIVGSADWTVCAADGVRSRRRLGNLDSLSGTCVRTRTRRKAIQIWYLSKCGVWTGLDWTGHCHTFFPPKG